MIHHLGGVFFFFDLSDCVEPAGSCYWQFMSLKPLTKF
jgi:hypothetical protein